MRRKQALRAFLILCTSLFFCGLAFMPDILSEEEKCPHCGAVLEEKSAFCPYCGKKIGEAGEKKVDLSPNQILERAAQSIFSVSAFHNRNVYDSWGEKTNIAYLMGTAFVFKKGYALADLSVIENAKELRLLTAEGKTVECSLHGKDHLLGIAILKIKDENIPPITLGDSSKVKAGETVYAIGFPATKGEAKMGVAIGKGVVSGLSRSGTGIRQYENFIQTDSPFADGMNGAPLLNRRGELIGMTAMYQLFFGIYTKYASAVGFASPINEISEAAEQLIQGKILERGWMGIILDEIKNHPDKEIRKSEKGLYVRFVEKGSPAEKALVKAGDIIISLDGEEISEIHAFQKKIIGSPTGKTVQLKTKNKDGSQTVAITLMKREDRIKLSQQDRVYYISGIRFQMNEKGNLIVKEVESDSRAYQNDIKIGFTLDDIEVKKDYRSDIDDFTYYNIRSIKDFEEAVDKGYSDYEFWIRLRFKESNEMGFRKKLAVWGHLVELPSA